MKIKIKIKRPVLIAIKIQPIICNVDQLSVFMFSDPINPLNSSPNSLLNVISMSPVFGSLEPIILTRFPEPRV